MSARRVIPTFNVGNNAALVQLSGAVGRGFAQAGNSLSSLGVKFAQDKRLQEKAQEQAINKQNEAIALVQSNRILNPEATKLIEIDTRKKNPYSPDDDINTLVDAQLANIDLSKMPKKETPKDYTIGKARYDGTTNKLIAGIEPTAEKQERPVKVFDYVDEKGFKVAKMSDGSVIKSSSKVRDTKSKSSKKSVEMFVKGYGMTEMIPINGDAVDGVTIEKGGINYAPKAWVEEQISDSVGSTPTGIK